MAQLEKQIKASQKFLCGLLGLPNFGTVRERQLSQILVVLEKSPASGTEKAGEILDLLDSRIWGDQILGELKEKIAAKTDDGIKERRGMQNFTRLHEFMPSAVWTQLQTTSSVDKRVEAITRFAASLGLRCPSEGTLALLLTLSVCLFWQRSCSEQEKYDLLQRFKPKIKKWLQQEPEPTVYMLELPGTWQDFSVALKEKLFPAGKEPHVPEGLDLSEVEQIVRTFPLRKTKTSDFNTTNQPQTHLQEMSGMNNMMALGSFMAGFMQRPEGRGDVQVTTAFQAQRQSSGSGLQLYTCQARGLRVVRMRLALRPAGHSQWQPAGNNPFLQTQMPAGSQAPLRRWTPAGTHPFLQKQMPAGSNAPPRWWTRTRLRWLRPRNRPRTCFHAERKRAKVATIQEQLVSLQEGLRAETQDGDPKVQKKPGMKRPAAAKAKAKGTPDAKPSAEVFKRPSAASGKKNWPQSTCCISMLVERRATEAVVGTNSEQTESSVQGWLYYLPFPSGLLQLMLAQERIPTLERDWAFGQSAGKKGVSFRFVTVCGKVSLCVTFFFVRLIHVPSATFSFQGHGVCWVPDRLSCKGWRLGLAWIRIFKNILKWHIVYQNNILILIASPIIYCPFPCQVLWCRSALLETFRRPRTKVATKKWWWKSQSRWSQSRSCQETQLLLRNPLATNPPKSVRARRRARVGNCGAGPRTAAQKRDARAGHCLRAGTRTACGQGQAPT